MFFILCLWQLNSNTCCVSPNLYKNFESIEGFYETRHRLKLKCEGEIVWKKEDTWAIEFFIRKIFFWVENDFFF